MKNSKYFISIHMSKNKNITQLVEFTFKHIVSKSIQKSIQHERKVSSRRCYPSMLHNHFIDLPLILGKKKYKVEKHHIYTTQWQEFLKKNTYKTILLEACAIKQRKIKLKFKENQKITWKLERKSLNWERVSPRRLYELRETKIWERKFRVSRYESEMEIWEISFVVSR